jgi:hypothetical protein
VKMITRTLIQPKYKLVVPELSPFLFKFALTSILFFSIGATAFTFKYLYISGYNVKDNKVSASTKEDVYIPAKGNEILETHIANNGMVFLKGARVISVDGKIIKVASSWGKMNFIWTIKTNGESVGGRDFGTQFYNDRGEKIKVTDIRVGQFLQINGDIDTKSDNPTIVADVVRT